MYIKKSDIENLIFFFFHGLSFYILENRKKWGVTVLIIFQEGQI